MKYNFRPSIHVTKETLTYTNYDAITEQLKQERIEKRLNVITIENYPIVNEQEIRESLIEKLNPDLIVHSDQILII